MSRRLHLGTPARLATLFIVLTTIPLAVLGWLGHRSLNQDRDLERTRLEKTLEQTIALLVRELDSTFERVKAGGMTDPALLLETLGSSATVVHIDPEGEVATEGAPLLYHARLPADEIDDDRLKAAQYAEFRAGDSMRHPPRIGEPRWRQIPACVPPRWWAWPAA